MSTTNSDPATEATTVAAAACPFSEADRANVVEWASKLDPMGDPLLADDPHPFYKQIREVCPVLWNDRFNFWMVTGYDEVFEVMRDVETFSNRQITVPAMLEPAGPRIPLQLDPPEHSKFRHILLRLFAPAAAKAMEPQTRAVAQRLLAGIRDRGECEFIRDFAIPLPFEIMLTWMGVPHEGWPLIMEAEDSGIRLHASTPEARVRSVELKKQVNAYFEEVLLARQANPRPDAYDVISYLVRAEVEGRPLTLNEMLRICMLLFAAGLHSTTSTVGNMMVYLSQNPAARDRLVAEPALIPTASEELMRWDSIGTFTRVALKDTVVGGQAIKAGDVLQLVTGAAGRDAKVFAAAEEVVLDRSPNLHLDFGVGPHRCLGSHIARMELIVSLEEIHRIIPNYRPMSGRPVIRHAGSDRGTDQLWLQV